MSLSAADRCSTLTSAANGPASANNHLRRKLKVSNQCARFQFPNMDDEQTMLQMASHQFRRLPLIADTNAPKLSTVFNDDSDTGPLRVGKPLAAWGPASNPMRSVLRFLTQPTVPLWGYCLAVFPIALLPSMALAAAAFGLLAALDVEDLQGLSAPARELTVIEFAGTVVLAPLVETLCLALLLHLLMAMSRRASFAATASALLWGALHAAFGAFWFFGTVWTFFVLSCAYLGWLPRSHWHAFAAAAVPHVLINLTSLGGKALLDLL